MSFPIEDFESPGCGQTDLMDRIGDELAEIEAISTNKTHFRGVEGIEYKVMTDAVALFYKSQNAIKSGQSDLLAGLKTWSITNYYEASYLSTRCLLNMLGLHVWRTTTNRELLIDLFPRIEKRRGVFIESQFHIIRQMDHWEVWGLLQRVLRTTANLPFGRELIESVGKIESKAFAKQRNRILYSAPQWVFGDLKSESLPQNLAELVGTAELKDLLEGDLSTVVIATMMFIATVKLFQAIAEDNPSLRIEFSKMTESYSSASNAMTSQFEASIAGLFATT